MATSLHVCKLIPFYAAMYGWRLRFLRFSVSIFQNLFSVQQKGWVNVFRVSCIIRTESCLFYSVRSFKATPHKACAEDAPTDFFVRLYRNSAGILSYVKGFLCKMAENMSADSVQSRQAGFVRCCLKRPSVLSAFLHLSSAFWAVGS